MVIKKYFVNNKWVLILGIILWVFCTILLNVFYEESINNKQPIYEFIYSFPSTLIIVIFVFLVPLIEELTFRGILTKNKILRIISLILMLGSIYLFFQNIWICITFEVVLIYFIFSKSNNVKVITLIFLSSLFFSLLHLNNYNDLKIKILSVLSIFGLSLILSYITIKFSIFYSILLHVINNIFAIISSENDFFNTEKFLIKKDNYEIVFYQPKLINELEEISDTLTVQYNGNINLFIYGFIENKLLNDSFILHWNQNVAKESVNLKINFIDKSENSYKEALIDILNYKNLYIDTILMPKYDLKLNDNIRTLTLYPLSKNTEFVNLKLNNLKSTWQNTFGIPFKNNIEDSNINILLPLQTFNPTYPNSRKLFNHYSSDDFFQIMVDNNINVISDNSSKIWVLQLIEKK